MSTGAIAYGNIIDLDATVLSASAALITAPVTNLKNVHVGKKWRDNATSTFVSADFGTAKSIDTVMLAGVSGDPDSFRVRGSSAVPTGGDIFDSGNITGAPYFDANYDLFVYLLSTPLSPRFLRIDIADAGVAYIEAGRWFAGLRNHFTNNYQSWSRRIVRNSVDVFGVGGQTFVDLRPGHMVMTASFGFMDDADRIGFLDSISSVIRNTGHQDMLWIEDSASTNLSRDCLWGYIEGDLQVSRTILGTDPAIFGVDIPVRQRL